MKTAIVMPTIRPQAGRVAERFVEDVVLSGVDSSDVAVYFSIDAPLSINDESIRLRPQYAARLRLIRYIDKDRRRDIAQQLLSKRAVEAPILERLLIRRSYASARNAGLLEALHDGNDFAINIDDDVFPVAPREVSFGQLEWHAVDFVQTHVSRLTAGADITRGAYLGYNSPLVDLSSTLSDACRAALGLALSLGNEVLSSDCLNRPPPVRVLPNDEQRQVQFDFGSPGKGVTIYGGNVGISLASLKKGRIPPFFCPCDARGEDTFFGLSLRNDAYVETIPAFVFHDPFGLYSGLVECRYPDTLTAFMPPTRENLRRFVSAFRGWVAYAPLWIRCQDDDFESRSQTLKTIERVYLDHSSCLAALGLNDVSTLLRKSIASMEMDFELLQELDFLWRNRIVPCMC
ncbi:MAG: hypothetical protein L0387_24860 [Acidobacteria bacterium]|nr:hypothetical protein [Acidobacteriota bacterium]